MKMKMKQILFVVLAATVFFSCTKTDLDNQIQKNGKPGVLTLSLKAKNLKTKAKASAGTDSPTQGENGIMDITVFLFEDDGAGNMTNVYAMAPQYFDYATGGGYTEGADIEINITTDCKFVSVVANMGSPYDATSKLSQALANSSTNVVDAVLNLVDTANGNITNLSAGYLLQTGTTAITWTTSTTASADVQMNYPLARITLESIAVTIADQTVISAITPQNTYILNAAQYSYLFPVSSTSGYAYDEASGVSSDAVYAGLDDASITDGEYYPILPITLCSDLTDVSGAGNYYYVWEKLDNNDSPTLLVIEAEVVYTAAAGGATKTEYYAIPFDNALNTGTPTQQNGLTYPGFSIKGGVHYHIDVTLTGEGSTNPYTPVLKGTLTLVKAIWEDMNFMATDGNEFTF